MSNSFSSFSSFYALGDKTLTSTASTLGSNVRDNSSSSNSSSTSLLLVMSCGAISVAGLYFISKLFKTPSKSHSTTTTPTTTATAGTTTTNTNTAAAAATAATVQKNREVEEGMAAAYHDIGRDFEAERPASRASTDGFSDIGMDDYSECSDQYQSSSSLYDSGTFVKIHSNDPSSRLEEEDSVEEK